MTVTARPWPIPQAPDDGVLVHHVSDTHFGYRDWSYDEGDHMLRDLQQGLITTVDLFVHTGDHIDGTHGAAPGTTVAAQDAYAKPWLAAAAKGAPSLWAVGNHDLRDRGPSFSQSAWATAYGRPGNTFVDVRGWRFVTFCPDAFTTGLGGPWTIPNATWDWLDSVCASAPGPVVLAEHYPPWELTTTQDMYLQPPVKLQSLVAAHPNIAGMLTGHMHFDLDSAQMVQMLPIGGRTLPVICDISSMLSLDGASRDQSARIQSTSVYVSMRPGRWEVRYRRHGTRAWGGPSGLRVTTMDLAAGTVTHGMG
jgi:Icc protein